jgi:lathosterol oxidase
MIALAAALHLALGMGIFSLLEAVAAVDPSRRWWRRAFVADALLWLTHPLSSALGMAAAAVVAGLLPRTELASRVATLPGWAHALLALVAVDFGAYALHYAYHRVPFLWAFHAVHHTSREIDWLSTSRLHPVSQAANAAIVAAPLLVCGLPTASVVAANALVGLWAVLVHANVRLDLGRLGAFVVSPAFHRHHHGRSVGAKNLGAILSVYDRLFGTWAEPLEVAPGTADDAGEHLLGLLVSPFARRSPVEPGPRRT